MTKPHTADSLAGISHARETLGCYSGLFEATAEVYAPKDVDELRRVFAFAKAQRRRVTFRAGGHSFDGQALGNDIVVSMVRFDTIDVVPHERKVHVGAGATWGNILARCEPHGLVPAVTVTTAHATAGGTLSGDCLSRFSPAYGKEGTWIASFDFLSVDGELVTCTAPPPGASLERLTREQRIFGGVVGGLGWLGAVVAITYRLLDVGQTEHQIGVRTVVHKSRSFEHLAAALIPATKKTYEEDSDPNDAAKLDGIYSAVFMGKKGDPYTLLFTSTFTKTPNRRRMALHEPDSALRPFVEFAMRIRGLAEFLWPLYFKLVYQEGEEFLDDLEGFTFFMDGNARTKQIGARLGFKLRTVQQTFIVPSDPGAKGGWDAAKDDLVEWLEYTTTFFRARKLVPTLNDVLFLPRDGRFLLSASNGLAGFAVSYAFETNDADTIAKVKDAFSELADTLWDKFQGRVYLVKNVCARQETLRKMYGENAGEYFRLKQELDPELLLRNDFLERTFGDLLSGPHLFAQSAAGE